MGTLSAAGGVAGLIAGRAALEGERLAFAVGLDGRTVTYAGLGRQVAAWSEAAGPVPSGMRLGLVVDDPLTFATAYLSLLATGVTVAPLNPDAPPDECWRQAALLDLDAVVTDRPDVQDEGRPAWRIGRGSPPPLPASPRRHDTRATAGEPPAVLLSSSGTTGTPKVVPLSERQLLSVAGRIGAHHRLGPDDRGYSPLPLFHVNAQVVGLLATVVAGASLVVERRFHRTEFWQRLDAWEVTWLNAVPAILAILADGPEPGASTASRLRFVRSASAPLPRAVQARFEERCGVPVLETYGMTEAASQITANPLAPTARRPGSAGLPVGVELRVVDGDGGLCGPGQTGSIEIRGPDVVSHYLVPGPEEHLRDARNAEGWLVTGDVGHRDQDGFLFLTGRMDDVINCGGEKIYPREIEDLLRAHPAVTEAVVIAQPDDVLGQCPVAYVTAREGVAAAELAAALMRRCETGLGRSRRPRRLVVADRLPTGPTGKVSRRQLRQDAGLVQGIAVAEHARAS